MKERENDVVQTRCGNVTAFDLLEFGGQKISYLLYASLII